MIHEVQAFVLECDARGCQREWMGGADETVEETRYEASRAGWVADGGDLCPEHAHLEEKAADCGVSGCRACAAMRDRAKAKAAEHVVEHMRPLMVSEAGRTLMAKAAEPSAPAAGTLSDIINSLPEPVRRLVHDIETNCDPAGAVRDNVLLRDQIAALEARLAQAEQRETWWSNEATQWAADRDEQVLKLAQAERERDEWRPRYEAAAPAARTLREAWARAERERDEWKRSSEKRLSDLLKTNKLVVAAYREADEATAKERARCLAQADVDNGKIAEAISNGAPAPKCDPDPPREVAPDRTQAGSGGRTHWRGCALETGNGQCDCGVIR